MFVKTTNEIEEITVLMFWLLRLMKSFWAFLQELRRKDEEVEKKMADLQSRLAEIEQLATARGLTGMFKLRQQPDAKG